MTTAEMLQKEGEARGEARGEKRGEKRGKAQLVLRQLTLRFGTLSEAAHARVTGATSEQLDLLAERVLTATAVEEALR